MAIVRWQPAQELAALQQEMNRLFGSVFESGSGANPGGRSWLPAMDIVEADDHYVLRADLPGMSEDDINIELDDNVLTISGERRSEHEEKAEGYYRVERAAGSFSRSLTLPQGVQPSGIEAKFSQGVLEVRVPK